MDAISKRINNMFETLFKTKDNIHPFYIDLKRVRKMASGYRDNMIKHIRKKISYNQISDVPTGVVVKPTFDILSNDDLKNLDKEMQNVLNYSKVLAIVSLMSQYIIKSNVQNEGKLYTLIKKDDSINIMIIGSGPVGLFLACYLSLYYNNTKMNSMPRVNIVMYDSRIEHGGFRKPYNRQRIFATSSGYLNLIIPKLYCMTENKNDIMINIFMLEYILFTIATNQYNIPMIFNDYSWDDYKKIIDDGKFDIVFDCTGGRLKHDAIHNIHTDWLTNIDMNNEEFGRLEIDVDKNLVLLQNDSKRIVDYYYGSITILVDDKSLTFHQIFDVDIMCKEDLMYFNKLKYKYFKHSDTISLIHGIKDDNTRNFLYTVLYNKYTNNLFSFDVWGIYIRHAIKISDVFIINKRKILYIAAGDTIFHSHFITGAGLNRILDFTVKCANLIGTL